MRLAVGAVALGCVLMAGSVEAQPVQFPAADGADVHATWFAAGGVNRPAKAGVRTVPVM